MRGSMLPEKQSIRKWHAENKTRPQGFFPRRRCSTDPSFRDSYL